MPANMETLAEPGVASHGHFPINMSGYYPKQETPSYLYTGSNNRSTQSFNNYHPGYPTVPESDQRVQRASGQGVMYPPHKKFSKGQEDVRGEKSGLASHQHSPVNITSYQQYMHQTQHNIPLSYFSHPQALSKKSDLLKDMDKKPEPSAVVEEKMIKADPSAGPQTPGQLFTHEKFNTMRIPVENPNYAVAQDMSQYNERFQRTPYYKHENRQLPYNENIHQTPYKHPGYPDSRVPMKSTYTGPDDDRRDSNRVNASPHALNKVNAMFPKERSSDSFNHHYRQWMQEHQSRDGNPEHMMNLIRNQDKPPVSGLDTNFTGAPFNYHKEGMNIYNFGQKDDEYVRRIKERQNLHLSAESLYGEKNRELELIMQRNEAANGRPYSRNEATLNISRSEFERRRASPGKEVKDVITNKFSESPSMNTLPDQRLVNRSPNNPMKHESSPDVKIPPLTHSVIQNSKSAKHLSNSSNGPAINLNVDGTSTDESCQKPKWGAPASPLSTNNKQMPEDNLELTEEKNSSRDEHDDSANRNDKFQSMAEEEISSPRKSIEAQGSSFPFYNPNSKLTNPMTASSPINERKHDSFDDDDDSTKIEDGGSFKKEVFSDDDCGEVSPYSGSRAQSPPSPDSSMTYPPHFPHPFFASPNRGHPSVQHLQFGSLRAPHESIPGAGYTYGKDFPGRFPLPGLTPDMGMGGPMSGHGGPYLGQMSSMGPMGDDKDIFFCHLCSYSGKSKPEFDAHMKFHFEYNCPHCDYTSRTEGRLKRHIKDFHSDDSARRSMPGRPKVYKCKQCQFSATEKDKFWEHARSHIKEDKLLQCPKCPFVTEYKHHLEYHLRNHFNSKPFKCNKCNYSCVNKSMLNSHMKSHTNVYQYRCSNCTYATKYCHSLKLHLRKYNHKPATVLNQDGSLPQGLDVEASGLSIVAKRGPPRGPRGPRKDKNEAYINHLYNMQPVSLGINPMINGMMPFWPMMPHMGISGHPPGHSNMLPNIGNFPPPLRTDGDLKSQMESSSGDINDISSDEGSSFLKDEDVSCRLCDFVGETTQGLCLHFVQAHQNEAREVAKAYGVSEATMVESMTRSRLNTLTEKRRLSEPIVESDNEHNLSEFYERNSIAGLLSRKSPEMQNEQKANQLSPSKWPVPYSEISSMKHFQAGCLEVTDDNCGQVDILQQMTLKFGDGALPGQKVFHKEDVIQQYESHHKEIPLDLTKPKSVSPQLSILQSSPDRTDYCDYQDKRPASASDYHSVANSAQLPLRKRAIIESEEPEKFSGDSAKESSIVPRKRSRKGKAYKLDTLCMKLQERQTSTSLEQEESGSDTEVNFKTFEPLQSVIDEKANENNNKNSSVKEGDLDQWGPGGHCSSFGDRKAKDDCFDEKSDGEETDEYEMKEDDADQESNKAIVIESDNSNDKSDTDKTEKEHIDSSNDVESEFEKLQRSLNILNNGLPSEPEEAGKLSHPERQGTEIIDKSKNIIIDSGEMKNEDTHKSNETENTTEEHRSEKTQDMEVDPVEMINTVLENRKKSLPPAVRRGTELAWKLLHDPVNPVTSIPLPIDSPPPQAATISPATTTNSTPATGPVTHRSNNLKLTPPFSYPARNYPPHHSTQPLLNPPIPMPVPPTPMAFIPPTSHMMPEAVTIRPTVPMKLSKQEEYSCTFCGLSFQDCVMYTVHMGYHSNKNPFKCNSCGVVCRDKVEFFLHIARSPHA